jgi:exodeoxyribonuclease V alpha subunit
VAVRRSVEELTFEGVGHLDARWDVVSDALLERWWRGRVVADPGFAARASRTYRLQNGLQNGELDADDRASMAALFADHARSRILCVTRVRGIGTSADTVNDRLLARLRSEVRGDGRPRRARDGRGPHELRPGAPVAVQRNDYDRGLFNGDQGVVASIQPRGGEEGEAGAPRPMAVFQRGASFDAFPLDVIGELAPAFAMTVHKAQGSEFDHVAVVLPEADMPLLTRELLYTALTRARRSVLLVGPADLLARAVSRTVERSSGVAERLKKKG